MIFLRILLVILIVVFLWTTVCTEKEAPPPVQAPVEQIREMPELPLMKYYKPNPEPRSVPLNTRFSHETGDDLKESDAAKEAPLID